MNPAGRSRRCAPGWSMVVYGAEKDVRRMAEEEGMELKEDLEIFKGEMAEHLSGTVEAVVAPRSPLGRQDP